VTGDRSVASRGELMSFIQITRTTNVDESAGTRRWGTATCPRPPSSPSARWLLDGPPTCHADVADVVGVRGEEQ
jgi:hypothetical protein